ncbi:MAG: hypothetical protein Aurels2KO_29860 [Aureliella sp.]
MTSTVALLVALCFADGPSVQITLSENPGGGTAAGKLVEIAQSQVVVESQRGRQKFDTDQIARIKMNDAAGSATQDAGDSGIATFIDGNQLLIDQIRTNGRTSTLSVAGSEIETASNLIAAVRLGQLTDDQQASWQEIASSELSSDILVLRRPAGKLERIEGIILGVGEEGVEFDFSGTTLTVPFQRLAGMRMFSAQESENSPPVATVATTSGSLVASKIELSENEGSINLTLPCGVELSLPLSLIAEIDFQSSRSMGLHLVDGNFEPAPAPLGIELASSADLLPRMTTQRIPDSAREINCLRFFGGGAATFRIPSGFQLITGSVKLASQKAGTDCRVRILVDSKPALETTLHPSDVETDFSIPVREDQRLEFRVLPASSIPTGATVIVKSPTLLK